MWCLNFFNAEPCGGKIIRKVNLILGDNSLCRYVLSSDGHMSATVSVSHVLFAIAKEKNGREITRFGPREMNKTLVEKIWTC